MQAIPQLLWRKCLKLIIDFSPLTVEPETLLLDAIALMAKQGKSALVGLAGKMVGWLTEKDVVRLVAEGIDFGTTKIAEVMHPVTITVKQSQLEDLATVLSQLRQSQLGLLLVVDEQGQLIGTITKESIYQLLDTDISQQQAALRDRQLTPEALPDSEQRFRNLVEASSDLIWEVDKNGIYTYVSPKIREILGYEPEEVLGKSPLEFMPLDRRESIAQDFAVIFITPQPFQCLENIQIHQNGHLVWLETSGVPVFDSDGTFLWYRGISRDITQRKLVEESLRLRDRAIAACSNAIIIADASIPNSPIIYVNSAYERMTGYSAAEVIGQSFCLFPNDEINQLLQYLLSSTPAVIYTCKLSGDFGATFVSENVRAIMGYEAREFVEDSSFWARHIHPDDVADVFRELAPAVDRGHYSLNYRFLHQDGNYRWVCDKGRLVQDEAGNLVEFVGYWADITEQKQLEQDLINALEKEKELNELKSRFISMTSHEFRTPLSTILSSAELLEHYQHKWTQEKQLIHLRRIQTAVSRMTDMLNEVLFISKADAGILDYKPTSFDLLEYCCQLVEDFELDLNNQRLISFTSKPGIIPCFMDEKLLGHILSNLLSNAIKYSPSDSNVAFTLTCQDGQAIFEIKDQGIGIPAEDLPHLFKSFHRASNVGNILGTGLGLAIVKKCVDIHQGDISVSSILGVGSKFTVTLPLNNQIQPGGNYDKDFSN